MTPRLASLAAAARALAARWPAGRRHPAASSSAEAGTSRPLDAPAMDARFRRICAIYADGRCLIAQSYESDHALRRQLLALRQARAVPWALAEESADLDDIARAWGTDGGEASLEALRDRLGRADEADEAVGGGEAILVQQAAHGVGVHVGLALQALPDLQLARPVGRGREGGQALEVDVAGAVGGQQFGRGGGEAEALRDQAFRDPEAVGDLARLAAGGGEPGERLDLVGGVHGDADDVLGEREFVPGRGSGDDMAGDGMIVRHHADAGQRLEGGETPSPGDDAVARAVAVGCGEGVDDEVLQQAVGGDGGFELVLGGAVRPGVAGIVGGKYQAGERNMAERRLGE